MNRALGLAGVIVALGASLMGIAVLLSGLRSRRPEQMRLGRAYAAIANANGTENPT